MKCQILLPREKSICSLLNYPRFLHCELSIYNVDTAKSGRVYFGRNMPMTFWLMIAMIIALRHLYMRKHFFFFFFCVEVLRPSQPNGVMSSAVSLPNHTFTGQA